MSSNTVGVLIIVFFIVAGLMTGGKIFNSPIPQEVGDSTQSTTYDNGGFLYGADYVPTDNSGDHFFSNPDGSANTQYTSPYRGKIGISNITEPGSFREYVQLDTNLEPGEQILISGWKLRSTLTGNEVVIGGAADIPVVGLKSEELIFVSQYSRITISPSRPPTGINMSFRVNKCMGYLDKNQTFEPGLSFNCPAIIEDAPPLSNRIDNDCLDYIETLPRCEIPKERDFPDGLGSSCEDFLTTKVSYQSCVANHRNDPDFLENDWRVYTGQRGIVWLDRRDNIQLLDNSGLVVDSFSY